jgi:hypothetical protein
MPFETTRQYIRFYWQYGFWYEKTPIFKGISPDNFLIPIECIEKLTETGILREPLASQQPNLSRR